MIQAGYSNYAKLYFIRVPWETKIIEISSLPKDYKLSATYDSDYVLFIKRR